MVDVDIVRTFLEQGSRDYLGKVRVRATDECILLYVDRDKLSGKAAPGMVSHRQLQNLKRLLHDKFSCSSEVIFTQPESHEDLEIGLFRILKGHFASQIESLCLSFLDNKTVHLWIEIDSQDEDLQQQVLKVVTGFLQLALLNLSQIDWINSAIKLPSAPVILRVLKIHQPVDLTRLLEHIGVDYPGIDQRSLKPLLERLRRKGMIQWHKPGEYTLTAKALSFVPAGAFKSSSDVDRALALGRRRW